MKQVLFLGEMLIDFIPDLPLSGTSRGSEYYQPHPGGAVANAAVAASRLGSSARFLGKLSEDHFGQLLMRVLQENGVETGSISTTRASTTLVLVTLQPDGQREFTFYRQQTADTLLDVSDLTPRLWEDVVLFHAGSVLLASDPARSATLAAIDQARQRGIPVSFDVNARPTIWDSEDDLRGVLSQAVSGVDLLKCSAEEAHYLDASLDAPLDPTDSQGLRAVARGLLARGPRLVVLTRGPSGALLATAQAMAEVATPARRAIDTTGAGDAFMGALLHQLLAHNWTSGEQFAALREEDLQVLGEFANRAAGISCTRYGGIASLPYLAEMERA